MNYSIKTFTRYVSFTEITPPTGYTASLFGGMLGTDNVGTYVPGTDLGDFDGYPEGAIYFLGVPGMGAASINIRPTESGQYTVLSKKRFKYTFVQ